MRADRPRAAIAATIPTRGLRFAAPLDEGTGTTGQGDRRWAAAHADRRRRPRLGKPGRCRQVCVFSAKPGTSSGSPDRRRFRERPGLDRRRVGQTADEGSMAARFWPVWTTSTTIRGWDMWVQGHADRDAHRQQVADGCPQGDHDHIALARRVAPSSARSTTGGKKKDSIHIYFDGVPQPTTAEADALKSTIRTTVPFTIGQRHTMSRRRWDRHPGYSRLRPRTRVLRKRSSLGDRNARRVPPQSR